MYFIHGPPVFSVLGAAQLWGGGPPSGIVCKVYRAWAQLIAAAASIEIAEPFRYDLVNTGREVLAQLAGPAGKNFTASFAAAPMDAARPVLRPWYP